jgi:ribosomal protein S17
MAVKEKIGIVVSNKMQKTIVVKIESRYSHYHPDQQRKNAVISIQ